jgi:hypothetical protein
VQLIFFKLCPEDGKVPEVMKASLPNTRKREEDGVIGLGNANGKYARCSFVFST